MGNGRVWTEEEMALLRSKQYTPEQVAKMLNRTVGAVYAKRQYIKVQMERAYRSDTWANGVCNMTCPDYCPYKDCKLTGAEILMYDSKNKKGAKA